MATSDRLQRDVPTCPECPGRVRPIDGEQTCENCGLVVDADPIDYGPEWRGIYDPGAPESQVRADRTNRNIMTDGLGTDADERLGRLAERHKWATADASERAQGYATTEIHRIMVALEFGSDLRAQAKRLFRQVHDDGAAVGRDLDKLTAGAVLAVARIHQRGLAAGDVTTHARTDADGVRRGYAMLRETVSIEVPPPDPRQRVRVVAREAGVPESVRERAVSALAELDDHTVANGSPSTLAAALLWQASELTQSRVADAAGVTPTGLRMRWQRIEREGVDL